MIGITSRALVVAIGGWFTVHLTGAGLSGLAVVAAFGLIVYGATLTIAFRSGGWWASMAQTAPAAAKSS